MNHGHDSPQDGCFQCQLEAVAIELLALRKAMSAEFDALNTEYSALKDAVTKLIAVVSTPAPATNVDAAAEVAMTSDMQSLASQVTAALPVPPPAAP